MELQTTYQEAILFAGEKHFLQNVPGIKANYLLHLSNVAMEVLMAAHNSANFNVDFAVQVALLHDTLEDTNTSYAELADYFGTEIAQAVLALTKDDQLPYEEQMRDSIDRIKKLPHEVWAVKMADRISNLQPPPEHWNAERIKNYKQQSTEILELLRDGNAYLANRLEKAIKNYS
jgi:guanosine-3',5'-bis(diphosphate) 3'-pyrophosphohydrolase